MKERGEQIEFKWNVNAVKNVDHNKVFDVQLCLLYDSIYFNWFMCW